MKKQKISNALGNINEKYITEAANFKVVKKQVIYKILAVAACLVLAVGVFGVNRFNNNFAVASTVSLDVNPSIEIDVSKSEKVVNIKANNKEAEQVLGNMKLKNTELETAVNAIIGSLVRNGYITEAANSVLVSVENKDYSEGKKLKEKLTEEINNLLNTGSFKGAVLSQTVVPNTELEEIAQKYVITKGKAKLINSLINANSSYTFEQLVPLTVNELNLLVNSKQNQVENVKTVGEASKTSYIGEQKAKSIALSHAGVSESEVLKYEVEIDYGKNSIIYEVDFKTKIAEYEYEINAKTGKIIKFEKDPKNNYSKQDKDDDDDDDDKKPVSSKPSASYISKQTAKQTALKKAGVSESDLTDYEISLKTNKKTPRYEVEFETENGEYSVEINAETGKVISYEYEPEDDD